VVQKSLLRIDNLCRGTRLHLTGCTLHAQARMPVRLSVAALQSAQDQICGAGGENVRRQKHLKVLRRLGRDFWFVLTSLFQPLKTTTLNAATFIGPNVP